MRRWLTLAAVLIVLGCPDPWEPDDDDTSAGDDDTTEAPPCPDGTDEDGDGYGDGCPAGDDCDDGNPDIHPGADENCNGEDDDCDGQVDEGVLNDCGTCDEGCVSLYNLSQVDEETTDGDGTGFDEQGNLQLDQTQVEYAYLWIANTYDLDIGTVSKIDGDTITEAARYYSYTCSSNMLTPECDDLAGSLIQTVSNAPSRTAVDFNFDVWVANRAFDGQPSVTKIANDPADCIDRNGNGVKDTSADQDGDGSITLDCNGDGVTDDGSTVCTNGLPPEFLGLDDECVLFTVNYGSTNDIGRSVCLDAGEVSPEGIHTGPGNAWVCTNNLTTNYCHKLDGATGTILETVYLPENVSAYGCAVDNEGILWVSGQAGPYGGTIAWIDTEDPANVAPAAFTNPWCTPGDSCFYGIAIDEDQNIWFGGWNAFSINRYEPDRTSVMTLSNGTWSQGLSTENTAGVAPDTRGFVWLAENDTGYIRRVDPDLIPSGGQVTLDDADHPRWGPFGTALRGVGVDFDGNVWGISHNDSLVTKMEVDAQGDVLDPTLGQMTPGENPYTYSDFTGYGLRVFTNPHGWWSVIFEGCGGNDTEWLAVDWTEYEPTGTAIMMRARTGVDPTIMGTYGDAWETPPADLDQPPQGPLVPNPAPYLQLKFELFSDGQENTPSLDSLQVTWSCP